MVDEGYIKYRCKWEELDVVSPASVVDLTGYRDALHQLDFIGEYPDGIGFGNISQRIAPPLPPYGQAAIQQPQNAQPQNAQPQNSFRPDQFTITGTQTGNLSTLTAADYAQVTTCNPEQNSLTCQGLRKASSESLTHGVIYASHPAIGAVLHVHSPQLWKQLLGQVPTTGADIPYGTPEMARETQRLFAECGLVQLKIFAIAGHENGVVTFGETLQIAYRVLINWCLMTGVMSQPVSATALQLPYKLASAAGGSFY